MFHSGVTVKNFDKQLIKFLFSLSLLSSLLLSLLSTPLRPRLPPPPPHSHWRLVDCRANFVFSFLSSPLDEMIFTSSRSYIHGDTTKFAGANKDSPVARSAAIPAQSAQPGAIIRTNSRSARPSRCFSSRCSLAPPTAAPVSTDGGRRREGEERKRRDRDERTWGRRGMGRGEKERGKERCYIQ